jgi:hypothetical protein
MRIQKDSRRTATLTHRIYIPKKTTTPSSKHSFVREASSGRWAMLKFKRFLIGREFTWITDCSGLIKFFETDYEATHTIQSWKLELLRFNFTTVHRPARMLTDCDTCYPDTTPGPTNGEKQNKKRLRRKLTPLTQHRLPFSLSLQKT